MNHETHEKHEKKGEGFVPTLRFPEFRDAGEWEDITLGKIADVSKLAGYEFTKHVVYENSGNIIALRGLNIKNNSLDLSDVKYIDNSELSKLSRSKLYVNDMMFTYIGTIGEVALIEENDKYYLAPNVSRIRVDKSKIIPKFILHYFNVSSFKEREIAKYISSSSQPALTMENVRKFIIKTPLLPEQQKIADCLSSLDDLITAEAHKLDTLKAHKKGLMQQLFPAEGNTLPALRFPEFRDAGEWETKKFSKYIVLYRGSSPRPIKNYLTKEDNGVNWIKIGDTKSAENFIISHVKEKITPKGAERSRKVNIGELILANSMSFGKTYQVAIDGFIYDGWFVLREYEKYFHKQFLLQLLNSDYMQNQYLKLSAGGIVQNISSDIVYNTILPHTTFFEQQKIADCLSSLDELMTAQAEKIDLLKAHKKALMQQLFPTTEPR